MTSERKNLQQLIIDHAYTEFLINPDNYPSEHQTKHFKRDLLQKWINAATKAFSQGKYFNSQSYTENSIYYQHSKYFFNGSNKKQNKKQSIKPK